MAEDKKTVQVDETKETAAKEAEAKKKADEENAAKEAEVKKKAAEEKAAKEAEAKDPYKALAKKYAKVYPGNKTFHITTDKQVFLEHDKNLAMLHQRGLKVDGVVKTVKID